jgi:hypothetical protein
MAFAIIFTELKDRKAVEKLRPVLAKMYLVIQDLAVADDKLARLIRPSELV